MLWTCVRCGCRYAPGLAHCPQCQGVAIEEQNVPGRDAPLPRRRKRSAIAEEVSNVVGDDAEDIGFGHDTEED